jgi:nitrate reductase cytochrome c-type subunit
MDPSDVEITTRNAKIKWLKSGQMREEFEALPAIVPDEVMGWQQFANAWKCLSRKVASIIDSTS